jgi:DivIVA domain-containing protein
MAGKNFDVVLRGYNQRQVDEVFARIDANDITRDELRNVAFQVTMRGYDRYQVHDALNDMIQKFDERSDT